MKKILAVSMALFAITSCVSLKKIVSFDDPYENVKLTKKIEKVEEKKEVKEVKEINEVNKKEVKETKDTKETKEVVKETVVKKIEKSYEFVPFSETELKILKEFKNTYNLVESNKDIERKTKEAIILINRNHNKRLSNLEVIKEINEVLKTTNTKSYTSAISRTINNLEK